MLSPLRIFAPRTQGWRSTRWNAPPRPDGEMRLGSITIQNCGLYIMSLDLCSFAISFSSSHNYSWSSRTSNRTWIHQSRPEANQLSFGPHRRFAWQTAVQGITACSENCRLSSLASLRKGEAAEFL